MTKVIDSWELEPVNGRKSFYGKAHCLETEKYWYLKSYETYMARVDKETKKEKNKK